MGKQSKFDRLSKYFSELECTEITLNFSEIEGINGEKLSKSAYNYPAYWYADKTHTFPNCWINNGYKMNNLNLNEQKVTFTKVDVTKTSLSNDRVIENNNLVKNINPTKSKPTIPIDEVLKGINKFYTDLQADENARYLSWEHCYKVFKVAHSKDKLNEEDIDYLSLHLAFYLASWGMLRGSSFLLQKDYRVHLDIIKELFKPCYNNLWNIDYIGLQQPEILEVLMQLIKSLRSIYRDKRMNTKDKVCTDISDILITKVLLGTMGCVPAYDEYFKKGVAKHNITTQQLTKLSIKRLADFYENNKEELESIRKNISEVRQVEYPQMKILDMGFWQIGYDSR